MSLRTWNVLTVAGLLALLGAVSLTAPWWSRLLRRPVADAGEPVASPTPPAEPADGGGEGAQRTIRVKLYFESTGSPGLVSEEREVPYSDDVSRQLESVVAALVQGSTAGLAGSLPPATRVLDVFLAEDGTAYVDLSSDVRRSPSASPRPSPDPSVAPSLPPGLGTPAPPPWTTSSQAELMGVYSVVDTLAVNFPVVKRVQILVEGQPVRTLWGHVNLSRPLRPDLSLLAGSPTTPGGGPFHDPEAPRPSPGASTPAPSPAPAG